MIVYVKTVSCKGIEEAEVKAEINRKQTTGSAKKGKRGWAFQSHMSHRREYFESKIRSSDWLLF